MKNNKNKKMKEKNYRNFVSVSFGCEVSVKFRHTNDIMDTAVISLQFEL